MNKDSSELRAKEKISCFGHPNISADHGTTFEITKDEDIGKRADCIIGVKSDKAAADLNEDFREKASSPNAKIIVRLSLENGPLSGSEVVIKGKGDVNLTFEDENDLVGRVSNYTCPRTLMIDSDKAAADIPNKFVEELKTFDRLIKVVLEVY